MSKTLKAQAVEWAADFWADEPNEETTQEVKLQRVAGARGYMIGHDAALAKIELDEGDLLGCCADYAELESEGGGTEGVTLKGMLYEAYYQGAKLAVERIKEGAWVKK